MLESAQLGRSLWRRRDDMLAFFDNGASNGPVEATNERLEHLHEIAPGSRKPGPLHLSIADPLGAEAGPDQRTLNREDPDYN